MLFPLHSPQTLLLPCRTVRTSTADAGQEFPSHPATACMPKQNWQEQATAEHCWVMEVPPPRQGLGPSGLQHTATRCYAGTPEELQLPQSPAESGTGPGAVPTAAPCWEPPAEPDGSSSSSKHSLAAQAEELQHVLPAWQTLFLKISFFIPSFSTAVHSFSIIVLLIPQR